MLHRHKTYLIFCEKRSPSLPLRGMGLLSPLPKPLLRLVAQDLLGGGFQKPVHGEQQAHILSQLLRQLWGEQQREVVAVRGKADAPALQPQLLLGAAEPVPGALVAVTHHGKDLLP